MSSINQITNTPKVEGARIDKLLKNTAAFWFLIAVLGQWMFAYYIANYYGGSAIKGDWAAWAKGMIHGIIEGDILGNIAIIIHILLAFIITFGGPLQLIPQVRNRFRTFHRWNGRIYIFTAIVISIGGLYMIWVRESISGGLWNQLAISGNALLIIFFAVMTLRTAIAHNFSAHRRWAIRTFIVVSGVWFFRIGFGLWIFINSGTAPGSTQDLTGPFDKFLSLADYLLPLFFLELYFCAQDKGGKIGKLTMSIILIAMGILTAFGIYMAAQIFWLPNL